MNTTTFGVDLHSVPLQDTYDFIVVGSGTAGAIVAHRLSSAKEHRFSVLLVEAGEMPSDFLSLATPAMPSRTLVGRPDSDWCYRVSESALHSTVRAMRSSVGRGLGGTSALLSHLIWQLPDRRDFDGAWVEKGGAGWSWNAVRNLFKNIETVSKTVSKKPHSSKPETPSTLTPTKNSSSSSSLSSSSSSSTSFSTSSTSLSDASALQGGLQSPLQKRMKRSASGPIAVDLSQHCRSISMEFLRASVGFSGRLADDGNTLDGVRSGSSLTQTSTTPSGSRSFSILEYLAKTKPTRLNLTIVTDTVVTRVVFDESARAPWRVRGVMVKRGLLNDFTVDMVQPETMIQCRHAVILCAGAIGTPKILQLSGLGNVHINQQQHQLSNHQQQQQLSNQLESSLHVTPTSSMIDPNPHHHEHEPPNHPAAPNHTVKQSSPLSLPSLSSSFQLGLPTLPELGNNLRDQIAVPIMCHWRGPADSLYHYPRFPKLSRLTSGFKRFRSHPLLSSGFTAIARAAHHPVQILFYPGRLDGSLRQTYNLPDSAIFSAQPNQVTFLIVLTAPQSRGSVELRTSDPAVAPSIRLNLLSHPADTENILGGIQEFLSKVLDSSEWSTGSLLNDILLDPRIPYAHLDPQYWREYIRLYVFSMHHLYGSCSLGDVVDPKLSVRGIPNLKVADASVIPSLSAFPEATIMMLAERCSRICLKPFQESLEISSRL